MRDARFWSGWTVCPREFRPRLVSVLNGWPKMGHELRRPEADYLRDGVYELRWRFQSVNYRILYFFHGRDVIVLSNGLTKEDRVSSQEIALAVRRKAVFENDPSGHTYTEE